MKALIVTGSRNWRDERAVEEVLEAADPDVVIHGNAHGADQCAYKAVRDMHNCAELSMPAQWDRDGNAAGPIRNSRMLSVLKDLGACGYEIELHAFPLPGSRGTVDMMKKAHAAGVKVINHGES